MQKIMTALRRAADAAGADFFGVADLVPARAFITAQGGAGLAVYDRAVSLGIALPHAIVDGLPARHERSAALMYKEHAYEVINERLNQAASQCAGLLQRAGFTALPVPASRRFDNARIASIFSHKLAAHLAGLGWIGKSCLLVTPQHGPRVRWITVLTAAGLPPSGRPLPSQCGTCRECVDNCPARAFSGRAFAAHEERDLRYDAGKCDRYFAGMRAKDPDTAVCGMCLYICPHGRHASARLNKNGEVQP